MLFSFVASFAFRLLFFLDVDAPRAFAWRGDGSRNTPCDCYLINGTRPTYYESVFWMDFRDLASYSVDPDYIEDKAKAMLAKPDSAGFFQKKYWRHFFTTSAWDNIQPDGTLQGDATYPMVNSPSNIFIEENTDEEPVPKTWLTIRTKRFQDFQTVGEFQTQWGNFQFVSLRMMARTIGKPGAVTSMFTYRDVTGVLSHIQESDVEILTRGPRDKIQYTNQPSYTADGHSIPKATINATTPDWSEWAVHRLDWTPQEVLWYFNGNKTASLKFHTPKDASDLFFSAWGDGGSWSGVMEIGDEAKLQIQWIHLLYNTTQKDTLREKGKIDTRDDKSVLRSDEEDANWKSMFRHVHAPGNVCGVVCSIDASDQPDREIILSQNKATSSKPLLESMLWLSILAMGLFMFTRTLV